MAKRKDGNNLIFEEDGYDTVILSIPEYNKFKKDSSDAIKGTKTSDDLVIKSIDIHAIDRMVLRKFEAPSVIDILTTGKISPDPKGDRRRYEKDGNRAVVIIASGMLKTIIDDV